MFTMKIIIIVIIKSVDLMNKVKLRVKWESRGERIQVLQKLPAEWLHYNKIMAVVGCQRWYPIYQLFFPGQHCTFFAHHHRPVVYVAGGGWGITYHQTNLPVVSLFYSKERANEQTDLLSNSNSLPSFSLVWFLAQTECEELKAIIYDEHYLSSE